MKLKSVSTSITIVCNNENQNRGIIYIANDNFVFANGEISFKQKDLDVLFEKIEQYLNE